MSLKPVHASEILRGTEWAEASAKTKANYVSGFVDGFNSALIDANRVKMIKSAKLARQQGKNEISGDPDIVTQFSPFEPSAVLSLLERFYNDPLNQDMQWHELLTFSLRALRGENISADLEMQRGCIREAMKSGEGNCRGFTLRLQ